MKRFTPLFKVIILQLITLAVVNSCVENIAVVDVQIEPMEFSVVRGESLTLTATVLPADATDKRLVWISSDPSVANVSSKGVVLGNKAGEALIMVSTIEGGKTASCTLTVTPKTYFPDANFSQILVSRYGLTEIGGEIDPTSPENVKRIAKITDLSLGSSRISSLSGIEYFENLTILSCVSNELTTLDLSANSKLTHLYCSENQLRNLDLSKNKELVYLDCRANQLLTLDLSENKELIELCCQENNLRTLDLSAKPKLTHLYCHENRLTALDLSASMELTELYCQENQLATLDLPASKNLREFYCYSNRLTTLDLSASQELIRVQCYANRLTKLDITMLRNSFIFLCGVHTSDGITPRRMKLIVNPSQKTLYDEEFWFLYKENKNIEMVVQSY